MAHINADQHGAFIGHRLWEDQFVQVTTCLTVDLLQHVGCFGHVEAVGVSYNYDLRWDFVEVDSVLDSIIDTLI